MKNQEIKWLLQEKYHGEKSDAFFADGDRLAAGEPLAYIIGHVPFLDCEVYLDSHPLIPRPETEYWTEKAIQQIGNSPHVVAVGSSNTLSKSSTQRHSPAASLTNKQAADPQQVLARDILAADALPLQPTHSPITILDLCAGSGAIGVAIAKAIPHSQVTFGEIDSAHVPTIAKNCHANAITPDRYSIVTSDLFANISGSFDVIVSNPPYIDAAAGTVDTNVVEHEPHLALFGGVAGMELIAKIITTARSYLAPHGQLWIEHEPFQADAIAALAATHGFTATHHHDQYNTARYSVLIPTVAQ